LDERNYVSAVAQLLTSIHGTDDKCSLYEEIASISSLHSTRTGDGFLKKVKGTKFIRIKMGNLTKCKDGRYKHVCGRKTDDVISDVT
jgi:hypothetical protein